MKTYETSNIRNIALIGAKGVGKTSFVEAALFSSGATGRMGRVVEGNSVIDYDPIEVERHQSIISKITPIEWKQFKINLIDTPGYSDFIGEAVGAMSVCDVSLFVVDAANGVEIPAIRLYNHMKEMGRGRAFLINKADGEHSDVAAAVASIRENLGSSAPEFQIAIGEKAQFKGVVDLLGMKAYVNEGGSLKEADIPADMVEEAKSKRTALIEAVAENDESLLEKYLESGELSDEEIIRGCARASLPETSTRYLSAAADNNIGVDAVLNAVIKYFPSPADMPAVKVLDKDGKSEIDVTADPKGPLVAHVFKTTSDPGIGDIFFFRVYSGSINAGDDVFNVNQSSAERLGHLITMRGKERIEIPSASVGDIAAVAKLKNTRINDTFTSKAHPLTARQVVFPTPVVPLAVVPKSKKDQDKLGIGLSKLTEIDPTFTYHVDKEFSETIVTGMGEIQIDVMIKRLHERYGVDVEIHKPHIPYREKITKKSEKQGKHKKQSGGHGQYGDCWLKLEPLPSGGGFEFVDAIVGGSIPGKYIPAIEKGVRESMQRGVLAGYPVVDLKVTVFDGSYHDVDSSDMSFQIAGSLAFKLAMQDCAPQLLEPVVDLEVYAPQENMGDLSSDISQRRGRVSGMDNGIIKAKVPMAELYQYSASLKSITSGAGTYSMSFSHYDVVPSHIAQKVIDEAKREKEEKK